MTKNGTERERRKKKTWDWNKEKVLFNLSDFPFERFSNIRNSRDVFKVSALKFVDFFV